MSAAVDALGDRWTLLILRDVIVHDRRYFRALLLGSPEGIASNILADRLVKLVDAGILVRGTAARGQRARYSLTEAGIQALTVVAALGDWGAQWRGGAELAVPSADELRARHLVGP
jgi:DNA-binding HxlR family transcriptional regulator